MTKIINLTGSPHDLQSKSGVVRLPAFGEVAGEFSGEYLEILRASGSVTVEEPVPVSPTPQVEEGHKRTGRRKATKD